MRAVRLLIVMSLVVAVGCDGGSDRADTLEPGETPVSATEATAAPIGEEELRQALLTIQDLPTGWTVPAPDDAEEQDESPPPCGIENPERATASAEASFQKGELEDQLFHEVLAYASGGEANDAMQDFVDAAQACQEWTEEDEGSTLKWRISPLSFPNLGDRTVAFRLNAEATTSEEGFEISASVVGNLISVNRGRAGFNLYHAVIGVFAPPEIDTGVTEELARTAAEKLNAMS